MNELLEMKGGKESTTSIKINIHQRNDEEFRKEHTLQLLYAN